MTAIVQVLDTKTTSLYHPYWLKNQSIQIRERRDWKGNPSYLIPNRINFSLYNPFLNQSNFKEHLSGSRENNLLVLFRLPRLYLIWYTLGSCEVGAVITPFQRAHVTQGLGYRTRTQTLDSRSFPTLKLAIHCHRDPTIGGLSYRLPPFSSLPLEHTGFGFGSPK